MTRFSGIGLVLCAVGALATGRFGRGRRSLEKIFTSENLLFTNACLTSTRRDYL